MPDINLQEVHDFLVDVAKQAGDVITAARPTTTAAGEKKNSVDLVTETDQATERLVTELVRQRYPHFECATPCSSWPEHQFSHLIAGSWAKRLTSLVTSSLQLQR